MNTCIGIVLCLLASTVHIHAQNGCLKPCTMDYTPVCGSNNLGQFVTFSNKCTFEIAQCSESTMDWNIAYHAECNQRPAAQIKAAPQFWGCARWCSSAYEPLCGQNTDGKLQVFSSDCELMKYQCQQPLVNWRPVAAEQCATTNNKVIRLCAKYCPQEDAPVCGRDVSGNLKTFSNKCMFENTQCSRVSEKWTILAHESCDSFSKLNANVQKPILCAKYCPQEDAPVCGRDVSGNLKTFSNKCMFENTQCSRVSEKWTILAQESCDSFSKLNANLQKPILCAKYCPQEDAPVCGRDVSGNLKTFSNKCMFENTQCSRVSEKWTILAQESCDSFSKLNANLQKPILCAKYCPQEDAPVCGRDVSGNLKTFSNKCMFENIQCSQVEKSWTVLALESCDSFANSDAKVQKPILCAKACTREFSPVCGADKNGNMKTFSNKCMFENTQCSQVEKIWTILAHESCDSLAQFNTKLQKPVLCAKFCPMIFAPVCGRDVNGNLKTFSNKCMFENAKCSQVNQKWTILSNDACNSVESNAIESNPMLCAKACTPQIAPVCGSDKHGHLRTFRNKCMFENAQCSQITRQWTLVAEKSCSSVNNFEMNLVNKPIMCAKACPENKYAPVCARDANGNLKTFTNKCLFENVQCSQVDRKWTILTNQKCSSMQLSSHPILCAKYCPQEEAPVCGRDVSGNLKTFSNKCMFENTQCSQVEQSWTILAHESCDSFSKLNAKVQKPILCAKYCPQEDAPVCGRDVSGNLKTFSNKCMFENTQCSQVEQSWTILAHESCESVHELESNVIAMPNRLCAKRCSLERAPVCGKDKDGKMKTFHNRCFFENAQCSQVGQQWLMVQQQACA